jgi:hypothetical protein
MLRKIRRIKDLGLRIRETKGFARAGLVLKSVAALHPRE